MGSHLLGLIAGAVGFILGFVIDIFTVKVIHKRKRLLKGRKSEVILIIECSEAQAESIEEILWDHLSLDVGKIYKCI